MKDIRHALAERLNAVGLPDFKAYPYVPDAVIVPCGWVQPAYPFADYNDSRFGLPEASWHFWVVILVGRIPEFTAQDAIDDYIDPAGPLLQVLQEERQDALGQLVGSNTTLMRGERYGAIKVGDTYYFGAILSVQIRA